MMNEERAKTKWCPFVRTTVFVKSHNPKGYVPPAHNRAMMEDGSITNGKGFCCIASECMAWQWIDPDQEWAGSNENRRGKCGLAK